MSRQLLLLPSHPYVKNLDVSVYVLAGQWVVRWRDFRTMKHDCQFDDVASAEAFAATVKANAAQVPLDDDWGDPNEIAEADRFWKELYP